MRKYLAPRLKSRSWLAENFLAVPMIAVLLMLLYGWGTYLDRIPPIALDKGKIDPPIVVAGDWLNASWEFDTPRDDYFLLYMLGSTVCKTTITRTIWDGLSTAWPRKAQEATERGFPGDLADDSKPTSRIATAVHVPFPAQAGKASYERSACYSCSGITLTRWFPICVRDKSLPFTIMLRPKE